MTKITKNTILKYISKQFEQESIVNSLRIFDFNYENIKKGCIVYLCEREIRFKDNFAIQFGNQKAKELNLTFKIVHPKINYNHKPKQEFINRQILQVKKESSDFEIIDSERIQNYLKKIKPSILIIDFNPITDRKWLLNFPFKIYEIDGHNIIPARFVSDKQEYNAYTFRQKVYQNIYPFLTEYNNNNNNQVEADFVLEDFISNKLKYYAEFKNDIKKNILSGLSKYINLGFISAQRIAIEVIKSNNSDLNKETFLEELIIRKELADNFCLYGKNYKTFSKIPNWAKLSLNNHKDDIRDYIYTKKELETCKTHDILWNKSQKQLVEEGTIHGYLRMYWAKKILEWMPSPEIALKTAIYLNDKYAYDAPSPNGYTGILWAMGGLHDRAFKDWKITGKIRRMLLKKYNKKSKR